MTTDEITWNPWIGCVHCSDGCTFCETHELVIRNKNEFRKPIQKKRTKGKSGKIEEYELSYKIKSGTVIRTCTYSDFFLDKADIMRKDAWEIIHNRPDCLFHIVTRRPERVQQCLPELWLSGWDNVMISVAIEDNYSAQTRIPILLDLFELGVKHLGIVISPLLEELDIMSYIGSGFIETIEISGESYYGYEALARTMDLAWVHKIVEQCKEFGVPCKLKATGSRLRLLNGQVIGIRQNDQIGLADFYKLNVLSEQNILNTWANNASNIEQRVRDEQAYKIYCKLIEKNIVK